MPESAASNSSKPVKNKSEKSASQSDNTNASANTTPSFNNMKNSIPPPVEVSRSVSMNNGKTVYVTKCNSCHALKNPGDYTVEQTYSFLKAEIPKAKLSQKETDEVTAYLIANAKR